ncbi:MAG: WD40 repeat domain-containing protein [Nitrospirae bacterium]|nr:WD40 repeat domain-containing protein [Nitrospirota bacterium]
MPPISPPPGLARLARFAVDALLYTVFLYVLVEGVLLIRDGATDLPGGALRVAVGGGGLLALCVYSVTRGKLSERERIPEHVLFPGGLVALLLLFALGTPGEGCAAAWLPLEWHLTPRRLALLAQASPLDALAFGVLAMALIGGIGLGRRVLTAAVLLIWLLHDAWLALEPTFRNDLMASLAVLAAPPLLCIELLRRGRALWAARVGVAGLVATVALRQVGGSLPLFSFGQPDWPDGFEEILPTSADGSTLPAPGVADLAVDATRGRIFYADAAGTAVARIDLGGRTPDVLHLTGRPGALDVGGPQDPLLALDLDGSYLLFVRKDPLHTLMRWDISRMPLVTPQDWRRMDSGDVVVAYRETPGLALFSPVHSGPVASLDFRKLGLTRFRGASHSLALSAGGLFGLLGPVGIGDSSLIFRIAMDPLAITDTLVFPEPVRGLAPSEAGRLLAASVFGGRIYEVDETPLSVRRVLQAPLGSVRPAVDPRRRLVYAAGELTGEIWAIRHDDGLAVRRTPIGRRIRCVVFSPGDDRLYLGTNRGILRIEPHRWLAGAEP